jgi:hypothetical protein
VAGVIGYLGDGDSIEWTEGSTSVIQDQFGHDCSGIENQTGNQPKIDKDNILKMKCVWSPVDDVGSTNWTVSATSYMEWKSSSLESRDGHDPTQGSTLSPKWSASSSITLFEPVFNSETGVSGAGDPPQAGSLAQSFIHTPPFTHWSKDSVHPPLPPGYGSESGSMTTAVWNVNEQQPSTWERWVSCKCSCEFTGYAEEIQVMGCRSSARASLEVTYSVQE